MLQTITLDDSTGVPCVLHAETGNRQISGAQGLYGFGELRDTKRPRPTAHGGINDTRFQDGKLVTLEGEVWSNVSLAAAYNEWRVLSTVFADTLDVAPALLKWTEGDYLVNLVTNPSFETDTSSWTSSLSSGATLTTFAQQSGWAADGSSALRVTGQNAADTTSRRIGAQTPTGLSGMAVTPGSTYTGQAAVNVVDAAALGFRVVLLWYKSDGSPSSVRTQDVGGLAGAGQTGVLSVSLSVAPPSDAAFCSMRVEGVTNTASDTVDYYLDAVLFAATSQSTTFFAGTRGLALQRLVKLDGLEDPKIEEAAAILSYQVSFFAEDPRAYSQTEQTVTSAALSTLSGGMTYPLSFPFTFAASGGGTMTVTNAGNRPTPPTFRIYGACTNPQIILVGGPRIALKGSIAAGDYIEVGVDSRGRRYVELHTAASSTGTNRLNFYDASVSNWFELPPGSSSLQLVASNFDTNAKFDCIFRAAYA